MIQQAPHAPPCPAMYHTTQRRNLTCTQHKYNDLQDSRREIVLLIGATAADMSWWAGGVGSFSVVVVVVGSAAVAPYCSLPRCRCRCRCHPSAASPPPLPRLCPCGLGPSPLSLGTSSAGRRSVRCADRGRGRARLRRADSQAFARTSQRRRAAARCRSRSGWWWRAAPVGWRIQISQASSTSRGHDSGSQSSWRS